MTDNQLIQLFRPLIESALTQSGYTTTVVIQGPQPTQEGIPDVPTVFFKLLRDKPYGFSINKETTAQNGDRIQTTAQWYETTFTMWARVTQIPSDVNIPTASDLAKFVATFLNSQWAITTFAASDVGILRIPAPVGNVIITNDRNQQEAFPGFEFTLTHQLTITRVIPVVQSIQSGIFPV